MWYCNVRLLLAVQSSSDKESTLSSVRASMRCDVQGRDRQGRPHEEQSGQGLAVVGYCHSGPEVREW